MYKLIRYFIEALFGRRGARHEVLRTARGIIGGRSVLPKHEMFSYRDLFLPPLL